MSYTNNDIHDKIKAAIKKAGISQPKLAENIGITYAAVNQWVNGVRRPSPATLLKIAEGLDINVSELIGLNEKDTVIITTCEKLLAGAETKLKAAKQDNMPDDHIKQLEHELAIRTEQLHTNINLVLCIDTNIYNDTQDSDDAEPTVKTAYDHLSETLADIDRIKADLTELQSSIKSSACKAAINKTISQSNIKAMRKRSGLTQKELADEIGISLMSMRRYENNERIMPDKMLQHIADILS